MSKIKISITIFQLIYSTWSFNVKGLVKGSWPTWVSVKQAQWRCAKTITFAFVLKIVG